MKTIINNLEYEESENFMDTLHERLDQVDERMVTSTEYLLPTLSSSSNNGNETSSSRMTATELSQLIESLHILCEKKAIQFSNIVNGNENSNKELEENVDEDSLSIQNYTTSTTSIDDMSQEQHQQQQHLTTPYHHWSLGLPLEQVVETDNETDRYSMGSSSVMSPAVSTTLSKQGGVSTTPCTPSVTELRLR